MTVLKVTGRVEDKNSESGHPYAMGPLRLSDKTILFGDLSDTQTKTVTVSCVNTGDKPVRLRPYAPMAPAWIQFRTIPETIQPGTEARIEISIITGQIPERYYGSQRLNLILDGIEARPSDKSLLLQYVYKEKML